MGMGRNLALGAAGLVVVLAGVAAVRAATFKPPAQTDPKSVTLAPVQPVDAQRAAVRLGEAIRFQTIAHQNPADDQLAEWDKLQAWLISTYPAAHKAMTREVVSGHTLIYTWAGSDASLKPIILMAHQDVVPITPGTEKDWKRAPFGGEIADGYVWGRGAFDDKGSLVSIFEAIETLATGGFKPKRTVILVSGHNEETRAGGAKAAAELLKARNTQALFLLDEGFSGTTQDAFTGKPLARVLIAEKGYGTIRVTAAAEGGHSSSPPKETAVATLSKAVLKISEKRYPMRLKGPVKDSYQALAPEVSAWDRAMLANLWIFEPALVGRIAKAPAGAAVLHTTIAPTMLEGSPKENVLPQKAVARINFRIAPGDSSEKVMRTARTAVGKLPVTLEWEKPPFEPTAPSSTSSQGWKWISALAGESTGAAVAPGLMRAGTDSWFFKSIAPDTYLFTPMLLTPQDEKMVHGTNEKVSVEALGKMVQFYLRLIVTSAG
jgi:carboxypeptidase PM20D1